MKRREPTWYEQEFNRPTNEEILAKAVAKLKRDCAALRRHRAEQSTNG